MAFGRRQREVARYEPTQSFQLVIGPQDIGQLVQHPDVPKLWVEVTMTGLRRYALAVDWHPFAPRHFYNASDLPKKWKIARYERATLPLAFRRSGADTVQCVWYRDVARVESAGGHGTSGANVAEEPRSRSGGGDSSVQTAETGDETFRRLSQDLDRMHQDQMRALGNLRA